MRPGKPYPATFRFASVEPPGIEPVCPSSQAIAKTQVTESQNSLAAVWQRTECPNCQSLTPVGSDQNSPSLRYIARHWSNLQPHIHEAIFTLIDAALVQQELEGGRS